MIKKGIIFTLLIFGISSATYAQRYTKTSKFRMSLSGAMGTKSGFGDDYLDPSIGMGVNVGAEYVFHKFFSGAVSYTHFFTGSDELTNYGALNVDGRYYIPSEKLDTKLYLLLGYATIFEKLGGTSSSEGGFNLGLGINHAYSKNWGLNAQAKYQTTSEGQIVINAGIIRSF